MFEQQRHDGPHGDHLATAFNGSPSQPTEPFVREVPPPDSETSDQESFARAFDGPDAEATDEFERMVPDEFERVMPPVGMDTDDDDYEGIDNGETGEDTGYPMDGGSLDIPTA